MTEVEIRLPELFGSPEQQLRQMQSYLYSLAGQLQYAFDGVTRDQEAVRTEIRTAGKQNPLDNFAAIKSLIIRSAEITEQLADRLELKLQGKYVAQSQFGTFSQLMEQKITAGAESVKQEFSNWQQIETELEGLRTALLEVNACIRTGLLYETADGRSIYGVEIGQQERENGVIRFRKFARLTAERLSFFDSNDTEVAYISDSRLHVTTAELADLSADTASLRQLRMGDYLWQLGADGHLSLR